MTVKTQTGQRGVPALGLTLSPLLADLPSLGRLPATLRERRRYRSDLQRLLHTGTHLIDDIGLSLAEARREVAKPFWKP